MRQFSVQTDDGRKYTICEVTERTDVTGFGEYENFIEGPKSYFIDGDNTIGVNFKGEGIYEILLPEGVAIAYEEHHQP